MAKQSVLRIIEAERLKGGLFITFNDGRRALYPTKLLYEVLPVTKNGQAAS